ncbi:hypothetical protein OG595_00720 [Streptomyces sp. NBC_01451]|nr:hypothetical protein [Streptomyces sp. NBC_01451]
MNVIIPRQDAQLSNTDQFTQPLRKGSVDPVSVSIESDRKSLVTRSLKDIKNVLSH